MNNRDQTDRQDFRTRKFDGESLLWFLFVAEIVCFQIFEMYSWGVYVMVAIAGVFAFVALLQNGLRIDLHIGMFHKLVFAFCCFCLLSTLWALDSSKALTRSITLFELLIFVSIFYAHYARIGKIDPLLRGVMWAGYFLSVYAIATVGPQEVMSGITGGTRLDAEYANINTIGLSSAIAMLISCYYALHEKLRLNFVFCIPCLLMVAASGSKKAFLVILIGVALIALTAMRRRKFSQNLFYIAILGTVAFFVLTVVSSLGLFDGSLSRMEGFIALLTGEGKVDASTLERELFIRVGLEQFQQTPILGIGIDNSACLVGTYLHNNYVELLCDVGIVGFALYYGIYVYAGYRLWVNRDRANATGLLVAFLLLAMAFLEIAMVSYFIKTTYIYLMVVYLYIARLERGAADKSKTENRKGVRIGR